MSRERRRTYIDWTRGIAVLLMIEAHTTDAWTRPAAKYSEGFRNATVLGGFAAPLFLWLAGLGVVLAASRAAQRTGSRTMAADAVCRRGIEIFILAFLFRLQAFVLSPGSHPITLFRVDILNVMGPAMAAAGLVWLVVANARARIVVYAGIATAIALATPIIRVAPSVDLLPTWVQWYLRPSGDHTTFTMFPWSGFVFAGAAIGCLIAEGRGPVEDARLHVAIGATGVLLVALGFWTAARPSIYASSSFWTSSPTWFVIRAGILTLALAASYGIERGIAAARSRGVRSAKASAERHPDPLARLGRSSLFVYWIHVELVYGYASWFWRRSLPLWGTWLAFAGFSVLMYAAVIWRDRFVANWNRIGRDTTVARGVRL
jgi:uncharacterized membrane protein